MIHVIKDAKNRKHEIKITDGLAWLLPYLLQAKKLGVPIWRIREIRGYAVPKTGTEKQYASCTRADRGKKFKIMLLVSSQIFKRVKKKYFKVDRWESLNNNDGLEMILDSFAHELSHVVIWNHTVRRYELEKKIQLSFARLSRRLGYVGYD